MDLLKLRLTEDRVLLKTIDEEPDTIMIQGCWNPVLLMKRLNTVVPPAKGIYKLQVSRYQYPGIMTVYKCKCAQHPCCWESTTSLTDGGNLSTLEWSKISCMRVHLKNYGSWQGGRWTKSSFPLNFFFPLRE